MRRERVLRGQTMITNEEAKKAIEKYQEKHPLPFGTMLDVTAISSKEGADIISQTIERISEKMEKDTELWCICEMAKMYMQGVRPVYPVRPTGKWITHQTGLLLWEECDQCGARVGTVGMNFCPNCGADMRKQSEGDDHED